MCIPGLPPQAEAATSRTLDRRPPTGIRGQYGPRPPSFARATYLAPVDGDLTGTLYVSGTASILADEAVHRDDVEASCDTHSRTSPRAHQPGEPRSARYRQRFGLKDLNRVKVYVREPAHLPVVQAKCATRSPAMPTSRFSTSTCAGPICWWRSRDLPMMDPPPRVGGCAGPATWPDLVAIWSSSCSGSPRLVGGCSARLPCRRPHVRLLRRLRGCRTSRVGIASNVVSRAGRGS